MECSAARLRNLDTRQSKKKKQIFKNFETWCWRKMLRVRRTEHRTDESILNEINERRQMHKSIKARRWNMIGHISRDENELVYGIIEWKIKDRKTSKDFICRTNDLRWWLSNYIELKRLAGDWEKWRTRISGFNTNHKVEYGKKILNVTTYKICQLLLMLVLQCSRNS